MKFIRICVFLLVLYVEQGSPLIHNTFAREEPQDPAVVDAGELGKIRGFLTKTRNSGRDFTQFLGIPYALSPVGERRFMPSVLRSIPLAAEEGAPFNATSFGPPCPQVNGGQEDCLFLNIATATATSVLVPVIVYIHGAAFVRGNANNFDGQRLLKEDLVVVSFNYRLGVFGYFGMSSDIAPGNAALYDAITVLHWVQKYIHYFGGDPNLVTLAGQSSGSASVTHLLLSPLSAGLFHRTIALSGTALNDWATTSNPRPASLRVAALTNCSKTSPLATNIESQLPEIMECMKAASVADLMKAQEQYQAEERKAGRHGFHAVTPSITFDSLQTVPTLLPDFPINILKRKEQMNVPLLLGATKQDGEFALGLVYFFYLRPNNLWRNDTFLAKDLAPILMESIGYYPGESTSKDAFVKTYLENCSESGDFETALPGLMDISTVLFFKAAALQFAQLHSRLNNTFLYSFDFKGRRTQHHPKLPFPGGVAHSDDTIYIFPVQDFEYNADEEKVSENLISIWANFAKTGAPSTEESPIFWPPFSQNGSYLIIDKDLIVDKEYRQKWIGASKNLFGEYRC